MAYAELAALRPRAGGEYVYLHAAFGRLAAFLTGWTSFVAGFSGAIAASAVVLAFYLGRFVPGAGSDAPSAVVPLPLRAADGVAADAHGARRRSALMSWIHLRGVGPGRLVGNVLAALKVSALAALHRPRLRVRHRLDGQPRGGAPVAVGRRRGCSRSIPVMFTYCGLERRRPTSPRRSAIRAATCRARSRSARSPSSPSTCSLNVLYLYVLPVGELAQVQGQRARRHRRSAARRARRRHHGRRLDRQPCGQHQRDDVRRAARLLRDGARRRVLPGRRRACIRATGRRRRRSSRRRSGARLLVLSGSADALTTYTGFAIVLFAGVAVAALFVLRRREPQRAAARSGLGLSGRAGRLRRGQRAHRRQRAVDRPRCAPLAARHGRGPVGGRTARHRPGVAALRVVRPPHRRLIRLGRGCV